MEKIKLLIELNKERLKNILEVRGITQEQSLKLPLPEGSGFFLT